MKKSVRAALCALALICTMSAATAFAEDEGRVITVNLDDAPIAFDVPPQLIDGRTMVPLRMIFEALGAEVSWDDETQTASGVKDDTTVKITIGEKVLYKNGKSIALDVPAQLVDDSRTLVPVRAISESFDVLVGWDDETSTVSLTSKKSAELTADSFVAGNGYNLIAADNSVVEKNSPVTVTASEDGVTVSHGGYYQDGKNWGGVALKDAHLLDGLSVSVRFDELPEVTTATDCWICIDFLNKPQLFQVGAVSENPGLMDLIRFGSSRLELYDGVTSFNGVKSLPVAADKTMYAVKKGDVLTLSAKLVGEYYEFTLSNGDKSVTWINDNAAFTKCFNEGKAHIAISASCKDSKKDAFKYTITDVSYYE